MNCPECKSALLPDANFCTHCGAPAREGVRGRTLLPWIGAGGALVIIIAVLLWPFISDKSNGGDDGRVPLTQVEGLESVGNNGEGPNASQLAGTPRETADRLFNRIMSTLESGDTAGAKFFLPMGIQAYGMVESIDADGLYHLSLLQDLNGDAKAARETSEKVLVGDSTHLLLLYTAAIAASHEGDKAAAKKYADTFFASFDSEMKKDRPEYKDHARTMDDMRAKLQPLR